MSFGRVQIYFSRTVKDFLKRPVVRAANACLTPAGSTANLTQNICRTTRAGREIPPTTYPRLEIHPAHDRPALGDTSYPKEVFKRRAESKSKFSLIQILALKEFTLMLRPDLFLQSLALRMTLNDSTNFALVRDFMGRRLSGPNES